MDKSFFYVCLLKKERATAVVHLYHCSGAVESLQWHTYTIAVAHSLGIIVLYTSKAVRSHSLAEEQKLFFLFFHVFKVYFQCFHGNMNFPN